MAPSVSPANGPIESFSFKTKHYKQEKNTYIYKRVIFAKNTFVKKIFRSSPPFLFFLSICRVKAKKGREYK
ncbi:hypothetical protein D7Z54_29745 [Salibacterium salarium]|uniref:Uncharacterized protein n=1 Tax=Salibacterium salarium TaxID=284579 RepID=A0A3R9QG37_9BACI|nr:hypothetical protein D7Z54_29745 [Salibacterium salarium]